MTGCVYGYTEQYTSSGNTSTYVAKCPRGFGLVKTNDSFYPAYGSFCRVNAYLSKYSCSYVPSGYCDGNGFDYSSGKGCGYAIYAPGIPINNVFNQMAYGVTTSTGVYYLHSWDMNTGYGTTFQSSTMTQTVTCEKEPGILSSWLGIPYPSYNNVICSTRIITHRKRYIEHINDTHDLCTSIIISTPTSCQPIKIYKCAIQTCEWISTGRGWSTRSTNHSHMYGWVCHTTYICIRIMIIHIHRGLV